MCMINEVAMIIAGLNVSIVVDSEGEPHQRSCHHGKGGKPQQLSTQAGPLPKPAHC